MLLWRNTSGGIYIQNHTLSRPVVLLSFLSGPSTTALAFLKQPLRNAAFPGRRCPSWSRADDHPRAVAVFGGAAHVHGGAAVDERLGIAADDLKEVGPVIGGMDIRDSEEMEIFALAVFGRAWCPSMSE